MANRLKFLGKIEDIRQRVSIKMDARNNHLKNKYATLGAVLEALNPLLKEHELSLTQVPTIMGGVFGIQTVIQEIDPEKDEDGNPLEEPQFLMGFWPVQTSQNPHKEMGHSTYARRYSVLSCLALTAEDDDGETAMGRGRAGATAQGSASLLANL